jgi:glycosyltransferase involved in cell wall biosynthesis
MKVLILITKSNWGGAQRYVYDIATNLPKDLYEVEVMSGGNGLLIEKLKDAGIKADGDLPIKRNVEVLGDIKVFFGLLSVIRKKRPDILHINSSKIGGLGALAGRLTGVPHIIFTAHGWAFNEDRSFISKIIIKFLHWITIILSHRTISVSESLKDQLIHWPKVTTKVSVIHNGIKSEAVFSKINARLELTRMNPVLSQTLKDPKDLTIIGSVGELHHIKGYRYALEAISKIDKKVIYIIISEGEERIKIEKQIKELGLESKVFLMGYIINAYQYLKAFDIFLLPSLSEGFPYIGLEAGLASLPIVSTGVGGIPEIIDDMKSGILIQPRKSSEIKNALEFYLKHKKTRKEHGDALRIKVLEEFSIQKMIESTIKIYSNSL